MFLPHLMQLPRAIMMVVEKTVVVEKAAVAAKEIAQSTANFKNI